MKCFHCNVQNNDYRLQPGETFSVNIFNQDNFGNSRRGIMCVEFHALNVTFRDAEKCVSDVHYAHAATGTHYRHTLQAHTTGTSYWINQYTCLHACAAYLGLYLGIAPRWDEGHLMKNSSLRLSFIPFNGCFIGINGSMHYRSSLK